MKTIKILSIVMCSVFLFSCGGKSSDKTEVVENETEKKEAIDCNCSDLKGLDDLKGITKNSSKELYTGVCVEKDQYDVVIREVTVKNGWLVKEIKKQKIQKDYITLSDYTYENGKVLHSWKITIQDNSDYIYISDLLERNGDKIGDEILNKWQVRAYNKISAGKIYENGVNNSREESKPKFFKDAEFFDGLWEENTSSPEDYAKILDCLKKEFPHFNYWKK